MGLTRQLRQLRLLLIPALAGMLLAACSTTRHVPPGRRLLDKVEIKVADSSRVAAKDFSNYLRQTPNHRVLGLAKMQLGVYSLSGADSTKGFNRWLRKIGAPPVIADSTLTDQSARQLRLALVNRGYNDASVSV
ncbi:MAG: outer membrane protein assembly factor, partial [Muribaculaceae bacterium]|nr:outer membrane protein assembly factor [Muribaculaceae bacterium]